MRNLVYACLGLLLCACADRGPAGPGLNAARGHWTVVNYWAQWCTPCIKEIPELNRLAREHPQIMVFGVNYDGASGEELQRQVTELGVDFPTLASDPAPQLGTPRPVVLPTTLILSPEGEVTATLVGPQTLESLLEVIDGSGNPQP